MDDNRVLNAEADTHPLDRELGGRILRKLIDLYDGYDWRVEIPPGQNAVIVRNYTLNPRGQYGFFIRKDLVLSDSPLLCIMRAGGEFLEQYEMRAAKLEEGSVPATILLAHPEEFKHVRPNGRRR